MPMPMPMPIEYEWRGAITNAELNALHAEGFGHPVFADDDWLTPLERYSLGWVSARVADDLVGFVNVAWDGSTHAFILDTLTAARLRRQGIGTRLVGIAEQHARAAGCEWLHVDFEPELRSFYLDDCGFRPTDAGLIRLQ
jgi:GNAT superfamily N-acetyltransferase